MRTFAMITARRDFTTVRYGITESAARPETSNVANALNGQPVKPFQSNGTFHPSPRARDFAGRQFVVQGRPLLARRVTSLWGSGQ